MRQKFLSGSKVKIAKDLGSMMSHFENDCEAIIEYTYAQCYGGSDYESYSIALIDSKTGKIYNTISWYEECQLSLISDDVVKGLEMLEEFNCQNDEDEEE